MDKVKHSLKMVKDAITSSVFNLLAVCFGIAGLISYISSNMHNAMSLSYANNSAFVNFVTPLKLIISSLILVIIALALALTKHNIKIVNFIVFLYCLFSIAYVLGDFFPATTNTALCFFTISISYFVASLFTFIYKRLTKREYIIMVFCLLLFVIIFKLIFDATWLWVLISIICAIWSLMTIRAATFMPNELNTAILLWFYAVRHFTTHA